MYAPQIQSENKCISSDGEFRFFYAHDKWNLEEGRVVIVPFNPSKLDTELDPAISEVITPFPALVYHLLLETVRARPTGAHGFCGYMYPYLSRFIADNSSGYMYPKTPIRRAQMSYRTLSASSWT
jgi:hypothetical protein